MKKIITLLAAIIFSLTITGCGGPTTYEEIDYNDVKQIIDNKEDTILFIGSETCSACNAYRITVNKIVEDYKLDIKYIDISKLSEDEENEFVSTFSFNATPTTIFIKNGKEEDEETRIIGNQKYSKVVETLTENGYIKE